MLRTDGFNSVQTAPAGLPVDRVQLRNYARVDDAADDQQLEDLAYAAVEMVTAATSRQLMTATFDFTIDGGFRGSEITLPLSPLTSVTSVTYIDGDGTSQTLSTDIYGVQTDREPGTVYRKFNQTWPVTRDDPANVTIRYVAGYATAAAVPKGLKVLVGSLVNDMYEHRLPVADKQWVAWPTYERLVWAFKVPRF